MAIDVITLRASKTYTEETARGVGAIQGQPGEKGDPGEGVPAGGTTGQVLVKKSEIDFDVEWQTPQASGGGTVITDASPTQDSPNPVQSGGVFSELEKKQTQLDELQRCLDSIDRYERYVNMQIDYCYCTLESAYSPVVGNSIPFVKQSGTFEMLNNCVIIKAKQIVDIAITTSFTGSTSYANLSLEVKDVTNDVVIKTFNPANNAGAYEFDKTAICVYENDTELDAQIGVFITNITNKDNFTISTSLIVKEIGRTTAIDPIECINDSSISEHALWSSSKINIEMEKLKARIVALENGTA